MGLSYFKNARPGTRLLFAVMVILFSMLVFTVVGFVLAIPLFDMDIAVLINGISYDQDIELLKFFQVMQSAGAFIVPPVILAYFFADDVMDYLKLKKNPGLLNTVLLVFIILSALPFINFIAALNANMSLPGFLEGIESWMREMEDTAEQLTYDFIDSSSFGQYAVNMLVMAILPAIGEELLFRGLLQRLFTEWTKKATLGVLISAFLFSAIHLQFYGFIPRFLLGALFGYLMVWSGSLWVPVIAHFINNGLAVTAYYISSPKHELYNQMDKIGKEGNMSAIVVISGLLVLFTCMFLFYRKNVNKKPVLKM